MILSGVRCWDTQGTKTQRHGVRLSGRTDHVTLGGGCNLRGNLDGALKQNFDAAYGTDVSIGKDTRGLAVSRVLTAGFTQAAVTGTTSATTMHTITIPAYELSRRDSGFRVRIAGTTTGTAGTKVIRVEFGAYSGIVFSGAAGSTADWLAEVEFWQIGPTTHRGVIRSYEGNAVEIGDYATGIGEDVATATDVRVTATLGNAADTLTLQLFQIEPF